ncbi:MAG: hypothetical protein ACOC4K_03440 [Verrucomicrobiota bacterium]
MSLFSESFFYILIYGALVWTALGAVILVTLLVKDRKNNKIW